MAAELPPNLAWFSNPVLPLGQGMHAQVGERNALPVKEPEHVVVGPHEEVNRVGIWLVTGEHGRVDVAVGRDEREASDLLVKRCGGLA
jgi:hypothetical protein